MDETPIKIHEDSSDVDMKEMEELVAIDSRGDLLEPSDLGYVSCVNAWSLYHETKKNQQAFDFLLLSSKYRFKPLHIYTRGR